MSQRFFRLIGMGCLSMGLMLALQALRVPTYAISLIAQAQTGNIPSAGTVMGWELNMNRNYSQKLEQDLRKRPQQLEEPQVIFFENGRNEPLNDRQFLLNSPKIQK